MPVTIGAAFYKLGWLLGRYPFVFIGLTMVLSGLSAGLVKLKLSDRIREGYTPVDAPSKREMAIYKEFYGNQGDPMLVVVMIGATDGGSVIRKESFNAAMDVYEFVKNNFSVNFEGAQYALPQFCQPYCEQNEPVRLFKTALDEETARLSNNLTSFSPSQLDFPQATIYGIKLNMARHFFGTRTFKFPAKNRPTSIEHVSLLFFAFRADKVSPRVQEILTLWETSLFHYFHSDFDNHLIKVDVVGSEILDAEMIRGGLKTVPYFCAGFAIMSIFVVVTVIGSALYYGEMDAGKLVVAVATLVAPLLAISTTFGTVLLILGRINSIMLVTPFLAMAIGVDDAFLMMHSWQRLTFRKATAGLAVAEKLALVLKDVGPSITITSLTNTFAFGIGALTPTPEIRIFSLATAAAMALSYLFEITFFGPILALTGRCERGVGTDQSAVGGKIKAARRAAARLLSAYCRLLTRRATLVAVLAFCAVYWAFALAGTMRITARMEAHKILPRDSPLIETDKLLSSYLWKEYHPLTILVNRPLDLANRSEYDSFRRMVDEFETCKFALGPSATFLWLNDYETYLSDDGGSFFDFFGLETTKSPDTFSYEFMPEFLSSFRYKHWNSTVRLGYTESHEITVSRFYFMTAYANTSSWDSRVEAMLQWREIVAKYAHLNASIWEANAHFVDQILSMKMVTLQSVFLTLICMAVICAVFIQSICGVLTASCAIVSISLGVFGFLSWWGEDLDPVVMAATLMSIGLSVDFTAHTSFHYQRSVCVLHQPPNNDALDQEHTDQTTLAYRRLHHTLGSVGWPLVQAGLSTLVCVLPLTLLSGYAPQVFVKTIFLIVLWGSAHGLIILPVVLSALPQSLTARRCCGARKGRRDYWAANGHPPDLKQDEEESLKLEVQMT